VWSIDSPGLGGSELDLMRVLTMVGTDESVVLHSFNIDPALTQFFISKKLKARATSSGNSWRKSFSGLMAAFRNIREFPNGLFIVWSHHPDSNRWLQLALALRRSAFILVERLVPSDRTSFSKSRLTVPIKRFVVSRAKAVIMVGYSQVAHYSNLFNLQSDRISTIPNTRPVVKIAKRVHDLRSDSVNLRKQAGLPIDAKLIVCVGRLCDQKNQSALIQAAARVLRKVPGVYVALLGDGPDRSSLRELSDKLIAGHVLFPGHSDPIPWLAAADVFVLPSTLEGLPGALIEAMAAGLPCIATDIPGNRELVRDGDTGSLVPVGSPEALAHAIEIMLTDRPFAERCAKAAYDLVVREYDEEVEKREWQLLFSQL
jgi:glycosyltransferase involved in cell wall biosynthesis